ncbi:MAG: cation:proton antiporter [Thermodesulfobacteriota bacterium]
MMALTAFVILLFLYSLISERLKSTILTPPILFTIGAMVLVLFMPGLREVDIKRESLLKFAELGLVMLLFTDAGHVDFQKLRSRERLPLRLLSAGMLLTILLGALLARLVFPQLSLWEAGILGAILAPTDAGLGQVIVQSPRVPLHIRQSLDVEAGLNDGLSVPFLMFFIAVSQMGTAGSGAVFLRYIGEQLGLGALVGGAIGLFGGALLGLAHRKGWMAESVAQLGLVTLPILCVLACKPVGGSMFIAAYVAGMATRPGFKNAGSHCEAFTEGWGQLFNYFVFFFFGLIVVFSWRHFSPVHLLYAILSLTLIRMLPVALALLGTRLSAATVVFMGWFGPRGLASIVLGLIFLEEEARLPGEETIKLAVIVTVMLSIFVHGVSALPGIAWYSRRVAALAESTPEKRP